MGRNLNIISKTAIFLFVGLVVIAAVSYVIFGRSNIPNFVSIILSAVISIVLFFISIVIYKMLAGKEFPAAGKYIFLNFFGKLVAIAAIFFLFTRIGYINLIYFFVSFAIFFTILLNIEIFLIYKKILFKT